MIPAVSNSLNSQAVNTETESFDEQWKEFTSAYSSIPKHGKYYEVIFEYFTWNIIEKHLLNCYGACNDASNEDFSPQAVLLLKEFSEKYGLDYPDDLDSIDHVAWFAKLETSEAERLLEALFDSEYQESVQGFYSAAKECFIALKDQHDLKAEYYFDLLSTVFSTCMFLCASVQFG